MENSIVLLDKQGIFWINYQNELVFNLYRTVYSMPNVNKELYRERIDSAGMLLTMVRNGLQAGARVDILNLAWGVYKIGNIEGEVFSAFFKKMSRVLQSYEGHERVVEYVNTCLTPIQATIGFQITQERMPVSAHKEVEQLDKLGEEIEKNAKDIEQMLRAIRESIKEQGFRLDEAQQKLKEREEELALVKKELEQLRAEKEAKAERSNIESKKETASVKLDAKSQAIRTAVINVIGAKDEQGRYMFEKKSQWDSIYMILKEKGLYDGTQKGFGGYLAALAIPNLRVGLPGKDMMRSPASGKVFASWKPITAPEKKLYRVAELFKEELEKLLPE